MKTLNDREIGLIKKLIAVGLDKVTSMSCFLEEFYFTDKNGRALIIQIQGRYAVFFMKTDIFDDPKKKKQELEIFFELVALVNYLRNHGYISLYTGEKTKEKTMFFLNDSFMNPQPSTGNILLNGKGDYTSAPNTIHNKEKEVVYKGEIFDGDTFEMILSTMTGTLLISQHLKEVLSEQKIEDKPSAVLGNKRNNNIWWIIMGLLALLTMFLYFTQKSGKTYEMIQASVAVKDTNVQQRLDDMSKTISRLDSSISSAPVEALPLVGSVNVLYGVDVSRWNGDFGNEADSVDSLSFAICKVTEGVNLVDVKFEQNWKEIKHKGLIRGGYHLFRVDEDPVKQADLFWSEIKSMKPIDISPILAINEESLSPQVSMAKDTIQINTLRFLMHIKSLSGYNPIIYTDVIFANNYLLSRQFAQYPLWLVDYSKKQNPQIPKAWKDKRVMIWQKSKHYSVKSHPSDFDICYGDILDSEP